MTIDVGGDGGLRHPERCRLARREFQRCARWERARAARLDGRPAPQRYVGDDDDHRRDRRLSVQRRRAELPDAGQIRTGLQRAGRQHPNGVAGTCELGLQQRLAAHLRHRRAGRQQPAEPEPADRPRRRRLQLDVAPAVGGCDADAGRSEHRQRAGGGLLRRSESAGPGDAHRRLLQVRHQLLRSELPERRQLPDRRRAAEHRLRNRLLARDPAAERCNAAAVRRADVRRRRRRCDRRDDRSLRDDDVRVRAADQRRRAEPRNGVSGSADARRHARAGLEPALQQPHSGRPDADRRSGGREDDAADATSPRVRWCRTRSRSRTRGRSH